jgi:porphobilinogen synthase
MHEPKHFATFPSARMRRMRRTPSMRDMVQETRLDKSNLIQPVFVEEQADARTPIASLPGVFRETEKTLPDAIKNTYDAGIRSVILFGVSHHKDHNGSDCMKESGLLARMIRAAKAAAPDMNVIADVCFCEYTDHGHCGPLTPCGDVDNDATLANLQIQAVNAAKAGADIIAPSGMMDGMVAAIRAGLDDAGFSHIPILSYAVKYASAFYGPFRDAAGCSLGGSQTARKDRKTYQMDPANSDEALREAMLDIAEGADMLMVKPGMPYLDIIRRLRDATHMPLFAYHVSGEFAMLKAAAQNGWLDYESCLMESLMAFRRAGCTGIITYGAIDAAGFLDKN